MHAGRHFRESSLAPPQSPDILLLVTILNSRHRTVSLVKIRKPLEELKVIYFFKANKNLGIKKKFIDEIPQRYLNFPGKQRAVASQLFWEYAESWDLGG